MKNKSKKTFTAIVAGLMAVVMALTGTFAWQSISQRATNEAVSSTNPGARLHDDFNGANKDVYVENFTDPDNGGLDIFARIRLDEYLEIGEGAGLKENDANYDTKKATSLMGGANINDKSTWQTYIPGETDPAINADSAFRDYYSWTLGGQTVYMPTFNMNKDSLVADINGTLAGKDGVAYDDYYVYTDGETKTGYEIWDADVEDPSVDELKNAGVALQPIIDMDTVAVTNVEANYGDNVTLNKGADGTSGVTHTAKATLDSQVITMAQWNALPDEQKIGNYWVYDTDGWAYWAAPIKPGTATGLLLNDIALSEQASGNIYYAIEVVAQFATAGDWGTEDGQTGFYNPTEGKAPTADALDLLNTVAGLKTEPELLVDAISVAAAATEVKKGGQLQFTAAVTLGGEAVAEENNGVIWDVEGETSAETTIDNTGMLFVASDETAAALTVKATSAVEPDISGTLAVNVTAVTVPAELEALAEAAVSTTAADTVEIDGINWYVLAKEDGKALIWSADVVNDNYKTAFGTSNIWRDSTARSYLNDTFLPTLETLSKYAVATTIKTADTFDRTGGFIETTDKVFLLTEADVTGSLNKGDKKNVDEYTLGVVGDIVPAALARTTTASYCWLRSPRYTATSVAGLTNGGQPNSFDCSRAYALRPAMWVNFESSPESYPEELEKLSAAPVSTTAADTVEIDGINWYVLAKEDGKALIWSADVVNDNYKTDFGTSNIWRDSTARSYLNETFLPTLGTLSKYAVATTIKTADTFDRTGGFIETTDKVFLLTEADVSGSLSKGDKNNADEYTLGVVGDIVPTELQATPTATIYNWLRSPRYTDNFVAALTKGGVLNSYLCSSSNNGLRPAMWVNLAP